MRSTKIKLPNLRWQKKSGQLFVMLVIFKFFLISYNFWWTEFELLSKPYFQSSNKGYKRRKNNWRKCLQVQMLKATTESWWFIVRGKICIVSAYCLGPSGQNIYLIVIFSISKQGISKWENNQKNNKYKLNIILNFIQNKNKLK